MQHPAKQGGGELPPPLLRLRHECFPQQNSRVSFDFRGTGRSGTPRLPTRDAPSIFKSNHDIIILELNSFINHSAKRFAPCFSPALLDMPRTRSPFCTFLTHLLGGRGACSKRNCTVDVLICTTRVGPPGSYQTCPLRSPKGAASAQQTLPANRLHSSLSARHKPTYSCESGRKEMKFRLFLS